MSDSRPEDDPARMHGIPEQVHEETPKAYPTSDRHATESVANKAEGDAAKDQDADE